MGLLENLNRGPQHSGKKVCLASKIIGRLPDDQREKVIEIIVSIGNDEGKYTSTWLATELTNAGYRVNHSTVLRHARKVCCCES